jgi:hypothetical protein
LKLILIALSDPDLSPGDPVPLHWVLRIGRWAAWAFSALFAVLFGMKKVVIHLHRASFHWL